MRCTCQRSEGPHHHRFGGTYPCPAPGPCRDCGNVAPVEFVPPDWDEDDEDPRNR
jgi:hypothetical protein